MSVTLRTSLVVAIAFACVMSAAGKECHTTCGNNAYCDVSGEYAECKCNTGFFGSAYSGCTSTPECRADTDCESESVCGRQNICESPCHTSCPADVGCIVKNHVAECIYGGASIGRPNP